MKTLDRKSMFGIFAAVAAVMVGAMPQAADAAGGRGLPRVRELRSAVRDQQVGNR